MSTTAREVAIAQATEIAAGYLESWVKLRAAITAGLSDEEQ
jgi:hypothetical protein